MKLTKYAVLKLFPDLALDVPEQLSQRDIYQHVLFKSRSNYIESKVVICLLICHHCRAKKK